MSRDVKGNWDLDVCVNEEDLYEEIFEKPPDIILFTIYTHTIPFSPGIGNVINSK